MGVMYAVWVCGDGDRKESHFREDERRTVRKEGGSKERKCVTVYLTSKYRVGHEKVARLPFYACPCFCINFCIYAMLRTQATFSWPTLYLLTYTSLTMILHD